MCCRDNTSQGDKEKIRLTTTKKNGNKESNRQQRNVRLELLYVTFVFYILTDQGLEFGSDIWMTSFLIRVSANHVKFNHGGEINNCHFHL